MGFFSWKTSDKPHKSIPNRYSKRKTFRVRMIDDQGNEWFEDDYEGYGIFGGQDYYELVDKMNGGSGNRDHGIELAFGKDPVKLPRLTRATCPLAYDELPDSDICPNQGYFY